jgi:hypothetical protein
MRKSSEVLNRFRSAVEQCEGLEFSIKSHPSPDGGSGTLLEWGAGEVLLLEDEFIH